jgi:glyoxylase-like metal-dependent hydrolase (beta-lactamase superfamily II)
MLYRNKREREGERTMIFQQYFEPLSSTYTYLIACERTKEAVLVDPVASEIKFYEERLAELGLRLRYTAETHVHADHVTGAALLRDRLRSQSVVHKDGGAACADVLVNDQDRIQVGDLTLTILATPGHTNGCVSYRVGDRVLTGDALLIGGCGRTDFQNGDAGRLYDSIHAKIFSLPPDTLIYPGHDYHGNTVSTVRQERNKNARLGGGKSRDEFIAIMQNLHLPYPKAIDRALPANQACGRESVAPVQG